MVKKDPGMHVKERSQCACLLKDINTHALTVLGYDSRIRPDEAVEVQ